MLALPCSFKCVRAILFRSIMQHITRHTDRNHDARLHYTNDGGIYAQPLSQPHAYEHPAVILGQIQRHLTPHSPCMHITQTLYLELFPS